jgi:hypothetical protein
MIDTDKLRSQMAELGDDLLAMADDHATETGPEFEAVMRRLAAATARANGDVMQARTDIARIRRNIAADAADERRADRIYGTMAEQNSTYRGNP